MRGLIELTGDTLIFAKLHMWFTWILRTSTCQISEELVHGPLSEDIQVRMERAQQLLTSKLNDSVDGDSEQNNVTATSGHVTSSSDELIYGMDEDIGGTHHMTDSDAFIATWQLDHLRDLVRLVGKERFHVIAYHVIVGNQVIVRGKYERLVTSIIKVLEVGSVP